jgi:thiol-disulfide isomerase/thioredoxin
VDGRVPAGGPVLVKGIDKEKGNSMHVTSTDRISPVRHRGLFFIALCGALALTLVVAPAVADDTAEKASSLKVGTAVGNLAPDFTADNYHGGQVKLSDHRGKIVLLDFWASWCGPCLREMPTIVEIMKRYPADKFVIIGVSLDMEKSLSRMKQIITDNKLDYPIPYDGKGWRNAVSSLYGVRSIPATFILDADGVIVDRNKRGQELVRLLDKLVSPKK